MRFLKSCLFVFCFACSPAIEQPDPGSADVELAPEVLQAATWNMLFFPSSPVALERAVSIIEDEQWDLLAMQELFEPGAVSDLLAALPDYDALVFPTPEGAALSVGMMWNRERFTFIEGGPLNQLSDGPSRTPMEAILEVNNTSVQIRFISIHLTSGIEAEAEATRLLEVEAIEAYIRPFVDADEYVVVLGDYNEAPTDPRYDEVLAPFFDSPERYRVISADLIQPEDATFLPAGVILDQTTVSTNLLPFIPAESVDVVKLNERYADFETTVSDHLPLHFELVVPALAP